jgi:aspartate aminotransferase
VAQPAITPAPAPLRLSSHLASSSPSVISRTMMAVAERKRQGHHVLGLHVGEPDFDTPQHIKDAGIAAICGNDTHYTAMDGSPDLKAAIAFKFARDSGLTFRPAEIVVSASAKMMIFMALFATVEPGDEVIVPAPYWGSYIDIVQMLGATPVVIATRPEDGFRLRAGDLEEAITPRTRWLLVNSPSNPSGAVYEHQHYDPVLDVVARHPHVWLIADDIYEHLVYDGVQFVTPLQVQPALRARTLTINGVSKAYAMTGWRIGYGAGPEELMHAMRAILSQSTSCPSSISQAAAAAALRGPQDAVEDYRRQYAERREIIIRELNSIPGLNCVTPGGAFYAFPSWQPLIGHITPDGERLDTDEQFCQYLLHHFGVAVIPGAPFGAPGHFRISYATSQTTLQQAMTQLRAACSRLAAHQARALPRPAGRPLPAQPQHGPHE